MATRVNMSEVLDNIEYRKGSMLYRGENLWLGIPPGNPGDVLQFTAVGDAPVWVPPGSSGSASWQPATQDPNAASTSACSYLTRPRPLVPMALGDIWLRWTPASGATFRFSAWEYSGNVIGNRAYPDVDFTFPTTGVQNFVLPLAEPLVLDPATPLALVVTRTDGTDTTISGRPLAPGNDPVAPLDPWANTGYFAKKDFGPGQAITTLSQVNACTFGFSFITG